jgi:murein DD-endopeptidase MepM/ murein hydrolase activator NlpD
MINDYKSRNQLHDLDRHRRHPRLGLLALLGLALCASAIYASLDSGNSSRQNSSSVKTSPTTAIDHTAAPIGQESVKSEMRLVNLVLPERSVSASTTDDRTAENSDARNTPFQIDTPPLIPATAATPATPIETPTPQQADSTQVVETEAAETVTEAQAPEGHWVEEKVKSGDSLAKIFSRLNLSPSLLHKIIHSSKDAKELANIRPGEVLKVRLGEEEQLLELIHQRSPILSLQITTDGDSFRTDTLERQLETRTRTISGIINNSLYEGAQRAGLDDSLIMDLANIFGWDIDFALEIRSGDSFSLVFEEEYLDGEKYRNGSILAAEFNNRGKVFRAVRFEDEHGIGHFFSPDGKSMRKAFLRAPVDFRRISSRFTRERYHPVLGKKRPHRGVDYAASTGTPIKAAGDGKVIFRGTKGGYGRTVIVQHGSQYTTLYAHMSKYRSKVKNGSRVKQGQVIGYVGKSGVATGPHLHYEFRVNGVHRNPLTVKLPAAEPIAKKYRDDFKRQSAPLLAKLDQISSTMLAEAKTTE